MVKRGRRATDSGERCSEVAQWCRHHRHESLREQRQALVAEAARALRVLRHHRKLRSAAALSQRGHARSGASGSTAARNRSRMSWARMHRLLERYPLPPPRIVRTSRSTRSEPVSRRAGCGNSARPDLWEPRAGNRPGLPERACGVAVTLAFGGHAGGTHHAAPGCTAQHRSRRIPSPARPAHPAPRQVVALARRSVPYPFEWCDECREARRAELRAPSLAWWEPTTRI